MVFNKKGQAALEFLTTYGWAFLVILVMIGALSYFGVFDASKFVPESCKLDGNIECGSYAVYTDGVQLQIKNNLMENIKITSIRMKERSNSTWNSPNASWTNVSITKQQSKDLNKTLYSSSPFKEFNGSKKTFELEVYYTKSGSNIANVAQGTVTALVR